MSQTYNKIVQVAMNLVKELNSKLYIDGEYDWIELYKFTERRYTCNISFLGVIIWDSWNYDNIIKDDIKESLRNFILNESKKILPHINERCNKI